LKFNSFKDGKSLSVYITKMFQEQRMVGGGLKEQTFIGFSLNAVNAVFSGFELTVHSQPSDVFCPVNNLVISSIDRGLIKGCHFLCGWFLSSIYRQLFSGSEAKVTSRLISG
jgi:hypothetical protein